MLFLTFAFVDTISWSPGWPHCIGEEDLKLRLYHHTKFICSTGIQSIPGLCAWLAESYQPSCICSLPAAYPIHFWAACYVWFATMMRRWCQGCVYGHVLALKVCFFSCQNSHHQLLEPSEYWLKSLCKWLWNWLSAGLVWCIVLEDLWDRLVVKVLVKSWIYWGPGKGHGSQMIGKLP